MFEPIVGEPTFGVGYAFRGVPERHVDCATGRTKDHVCCSVGGILRALQHHRRDVRKLIVATTTYRVRDDKPESVSRHATGVHQPLLR